MEDYKKLKKQLHSLIGKIKFNPSSNLKLERIIHLLELLGNPQDKFLSIHVGGTSGKGSTATMISFILQEAGYKIGLHVSPYLQVINEGFQINNSLVSSSKLLKLMDKVMPAVEQVSRENPFGKPSYFEAKVALAFLLFAEEKIDVAIVEVGLGGKLDATNVLKSKVSVLTNVGLDHTAILGNTIEKIITDKAEIIKPNQIVISGVTQESAKKIVTDKTKKVGAKLLQYNQDFKENHDLEIGLLGDFQQINAACAIEAAQAFSNQKITDQQIETGLKKARIPGRMEIIQKKPLVILDGAHNPDKMTALINSLKRRYPHKKWLSVISFKEDKDIDKMLKILTKNNETIITTEFYGTPLWGAYSATELSEKVKNQNPSIKTLVNKNPIEALEKALEITKNKPDTLVLITGSLYLIGNIRNYWYPIEKLI